MKTIIFGTEQLADIAFFYLKNDSIHQPSAFCVDSPYIKRESFNELPVHSSEDIEKFCSPKDYNFIVPVTSNKLRESKYSFFKSKGYKFINYVSSKSIVNSRLGENCFVLENNNIQPFVTFGSNIVLWSGNHIGHHSVIKDNVFFSSHVVLSGNCLVESYCYFGVNSSVRDSVTVAEGTFIGMSSVVTKSTVSYKKYFGCPAKEIGIWDGN